MNAAVNAASPRFRRSRLEAREGPRDTNKPLGCCGERIISSKYCSQHRCCSATEGTVARDVFRKRRSNQKRLPRRIGNRQIVIIGLAILNGSDRAPEIVGVLGVPRDNGCISQGDIQHGE